MLKRQVVQAILWCGVLALVLCAFPTRMLAQTMRIAYGDTVEGRFNPNNPRIFYEFSAEAGDSVSVTVTSVGADVSLGVSINVDRFTEIMAVYGDPGTERLLTDVYLPVDGVYSIYLTTSTGEGEFVLTLERVSTAADRVVLFEEDFDDNSADWETGGNDVISAAVEDGAYVVEATCGEDAWFGAAGLNDAAAAPVFEPPYVVEADVTVEPGEGSVVVGLMFGVDQPGYETLNIIYYDISGYIDYRFLDEQTGGRIESLGADQVPSVEIADGEPHVLRLYVTEQDVVLWVDDEPVNQRLVITDSTGTVGLAAGCAFYDPMPTVHVSYDNVLVTASPEAEA